MRWLPPLLACATGFIAGCPGSAGTDPPGGTRPCESDELWGNFALWTDGNAGGFEGVHHDGPSPLLQEDVIVEGDCVLRGFEPMPHCEPGCDPPLVCGLGDVCLGWPVTLDVGTIQITGTDPPLTLEPGFDHQYYTDDPVPDLVRPDGHYTLTASGSAQVDGFSLTVAGIAAFADHASSVTVTSGNPLDVWWEPAGGTARVVVEMGADHHAGTNTYARCETDDAVGTLTIPASIVDGVLTAGAGGLGSTTLVRYRASTTPTDRGCASFATYTKQWLDTTID
jgi:hypothetical protein